MIKNKLSCLKNRKAKKKKLKKKRNYHICEKSVLNLLHLECRSINLTNLRNILLQQNKQYS